jgi:cyclopropane fatty-acyl-phospholipid synthase-like methyltransferase
MRASRESVLAALRSPVPAASMTPGTGRYRHHYAAHGAAFWGDDLAAAVDCFFTARPALDGSRVLDLGAGTGRHCFEAARRGATAVDAVELDAVAAQFILEGSLRLEHAGIVPEGVIRLHAMNAVEYLRGTTFAGYDLIICYGMLHVLARDDADSVLKDFERTLKPGGTLILQFLTNKFAAPREQPELGDVWISPEYAARILDSGAWDVWWRNDTDIRHSHISAEDHRHGSQRFLADRR